MERPVRASVEVVLDGRRYCAGKVAIHALGKQSRCNASNARKNIRTRAVVVVLIRDVTQAHIVSRSNHVIDFCKVIARIEKVRIPEKKLS